MKTTLRLLAIVAGILAIEATAQVWNEPNLIANGDFESTPFMSGWQHVAGDNYPVELEATQHIDLPNHAGSSIQIVGSSVWQLIPGIVPGDSLQLTIDISNRGADWTSAGAFVTWVDPDGSPSDCFDANIGFNQPLNPYWTSETRELSVFECGGWVPGSFLKVTLVGNLQNETWNPYFDNIGLRVRHQDTNTSVLELTQESDRIRVKASEIVIVDLSGRVQHASVSRDSDASTIDTAELATGIYVIKTENGSRKFFKE